MLNSGNQKAFLSRTYWHQAPEPLIFEHIITGGKHFEKTPVDPKNDISKTMNIFKRTWLLAWLFPLVWSCTPPRSQNPQVEQASLAIPIVATQTTDYVVSRRGKILHAKRLPEMFTPAWVDTLKFPLIDDRLALALKHQLHVLEQRGPDTFRFGNRLVSKAEMAQVIQYLLERRDLIPMDPAFFLDAMQSWGKDARGHVRMTGYYTPTIKVSHEQTKRFWYPIYARPKEWQGPWPTRAQIDGAGALKGRAEVIAWAEDPVEVYYMQLQGSGYATFVDTGEKVVLAYDGTNRHPYRSIETFLLSRKDLRIKDLTISGIKRFLKAHPQLRDTVLFSNPSYVFFRLRRGTVKGAGQVPLLEGISVAADPKYFPLGSVLLAWIPQYNEKGRVSGHAFKILLPQDTGGAIRGPGHLDIYSGVGRKGERIASMRHHYGRVWVLLPKSNDQIAFQPLALP